VKRSVVLEFSRLKEKTVIELDGSRSSRTVDAIIKSLPLEIIMNRWGDELYSEPTEIKMEEENAVSIVDLFDVAFWPEGSALCFFYGRTPISNDRILPYSPVNVVGKIKSRPSSVSEFLRAVEDSHVNGRIPVSLYTLR
jgi:hypothetical protein